MAPMRALVLMTLDLLGLALLVAAAWMAWGLGAGLGALGISVLVFGFQLEHMLDERPRRPPS